MRRALRCGYNLAHTHLWSATSCTTIVPPMGLPTRQLGYLDPLVPRQKQICHFHSTVNLRFPENSANTASPTPADPSTSSGTPAASSSVILPGWRGAATYFMIGYGAGVFGSALGLGGGVIMVPLLVKLGLPQARAHGTSLVAVAGTSVAGAYTYFTGGFVEFTAAAMLAFTAIPTAGIGAYVASRLHGIQLKKYFGWWLVMAASVIPIKAYLPTLVDFGTAATVGGVHYWVSIGCLGSAAGFLSALLGVGGGTLMVPCLVLGGFTQQMAQGTALCGMVAPALFGSSQHHMWGNVAVQVAPFLVLGALLGGASGGMFAIYLPELTLRIIFCLGLYALGFRYIRS